MDNFSSRRPTSWPRAARTACSLSPTAPGSSASTTPAKSSQWLDVDAGDDHDGSGEGWWR